MRLKYCTAAEIFASAPSLRDNGTMLNGTTCPSCGENIPEGAHYCARCVGDTIERPLIPAPLISAYRMVKPLGTGGMGAVYLAEENESKRLVAIKIISKALGQDSRGRNRFLREARTMATVQHPHVVQFYSAGEFSGQPYLVMQYVEGETLADRIKRDGSLPVSESLRILRQAVEALAAAWEKNIVHRDIKPSNILLDKNERAHVADFGLAKSFQIETDSSLTQSGAIIGSPHYISPEQAQGRSVDFRSDIYALGIVLYEMLVGGRPFEDTTPLAIVLKHLNTPLPSPREKRRDLPEGIVRLLQWMTQKDPAKRPSSYAELLSRIDDLLTGKPSTKKRAMALLAVAAVLAVSFFVLRPSHTKKDQPPVMKTASSAPVVPAPAPRPVSVVTINAIPWARLQLKPHGFEMPAIAEENRITPAYFFLPEGEYTVELSNDTKGQPYEQIIKVRAGAVNAFTFTMPHYDPKKSVQRVRRQ